MMKNSSANSAKFKKSLVTLLQHFNFPYFSLKNSIANKPPDVCLFTLLFELIYFHEFNRVPSESISVHFTLHFSLNQKLDFLEKRCSKLIISSRLAENSQSSILSVFKQEKHDEIDRATLIWRLIGQFWRSTNLLQQFIQFHIAAASTNHHFDAQLNELIIAQFLQKSGQSEPVKPRDALSSLHTALHKLTCNGGGGVDWQDADSLSEMLARKNLIRSQLADVYWLERCVQRLHSRLYHSSEAAPPQKFTPHLLFLIQSLSSDLSSSSVSSNQTKQHSQMLEQCVELLRDWMKISDCLINFPASCFLSEPINGSGQDELNRVDDDAIKTEAFSNHNHQKKKEKKKNPYYHHRLTIAELKSKIGDIKSRLDCAATTVMVTSHGNSIDPLHKDLLVHEFARVMQFSGALNLRAIKSRLVEIDNQKSVQKAQKNKQAMGRARATLNQKKYPNFNGEDLAHQIEICAEKILEIELEKLQNCWKDSECTLNDKILLQKIIEKRPDLVVSMGDIDDENKD